MEPSLRPPPPRFSFRETLRMATSGFAEGLLHPATCWLALAGVVIGGLLLPAKGIGFSTCGFRNWSGLPCPGCGLTRSVSSVLQGHLAWAWDYNPFGILIAGVFVVLAPLAFLPGSLRRRLVARVARYDAWFAGALFGGCAALLLYGAARAVLVYAGAFDWKG